MGVIQESLVFAVRGWRLRLLTLVALAVLFFAVGPDTASRGTDDPSAGRSDDGARILLLATRVFDGNELRNKAGVLLAGREIVAVGSAEELRGRADRAIDLGDSTTSQGS
jgi:hypothetical protein